MKETIINIAVGDLVRQRRGDHPSHQKILERRDQTGVVVRLYETAGPLAMWSPLTAEILWSDGVVASGFLVSALEVICEDTGST
jgi:hypothetical protein